jgi:phenylalanyl-tRNA synthetase beta chain
MGSRHPVFVAELDTGALQKAVVREVKFDELPRFPSVSRDVAMETEGDFPNSRFEDFFAGLKEPLFAGAVIFDVFSDPEGVKLARGRKSVAYTLTYRDRSRTLEGSEVDAVHQRVLAALTKALPVTIR